MAGEFLLGISGHVLLTQYLSSKPNLKALNRISQVMKGLIARL